MKYIEIFLSVFLEKATKKQIPVQSQRNKHYKKMRNMFRVNNKKDTRATLMTSFWWLYCWIWVGKSLLGWLNINDIAHSRLIKENLTKSDFNRYYFTVLYLVEMVDMNLFFIAPVFFWLYPHPITIINYHFNLHRIVF